MVTMGSREVVPVEEKAEQLTKYAGVS